MPDIANYETFIKSITSVISNISVIVGVVVFWFATYQFKVNQRWKSNEFIAKEMHDFISDNTTREVISILDYRKKRFSAKIGVCDVMITTYHTNADLPPTHDGEYHVSLSAAFEPRPGESIPAGEELIRDKFDLYFNYIERFAVFEEANLYSKAQLYRFIRYHIDILNGLKDHSDGYHKNLYRYLVYYNFDLVVKLLNIYDKSEKSELFWREAFDEVNARHVTRAPRSRYLGI